MIQVIIIPENDPINATNPFFVKPATRKMVSAERIVTIVSERIIGSTYRRYPGSITFQITSVVIKKDMIALKPIHPAYRTSRKTNSS